MYDNYIFCKKYKGLKNTIASILNGDDLETDIEKLADHIQQLYEDGAMPASQYDDLMRYIQDIKENKNNRIEVLTNKGDNWHV